MPAKRLIVAQRADKQFLKLPRFIQSKIISSYDRIKHNPIIGEKLHGELKDFYKYRVGNYRIVYWFDVKTSTVIVTKIEHRQGAYK